jgi:predicted ATPase
MRGRVVLKITELRIINYKGFADSGFVALNPAWNVIVGQNNAGKTAFIEGFRLLRNENRLHKNISFPRDHPFPTESRFVVRMTFSREWLKNAWLRRGGIFDLPHGGSDQHGNRFAIDPKGFWDGEDLAPELEFRAGQGVISGWPSHRLFETHGGEQYVQILTTADRKVGDIGGTGNGRSDSLPLLVQENYFTHIYMFEAKRFAVGECGHEDSAILKPDASNLPAVLIKLAGNPDLFREFQQNVSTIFSSIKGVSVTTKGGNFEIRLWPIDPETRRDDLTVPLNESGTGVGQVLAILYVAMTNEPGVIAIDEPNSFLHPGAAKKLIQILKRYPQHQYVISTHSPEVIGAAQPAALHLVRFNGKESVVETLGEGEIETKRMMLEEVGASLGDIFSAERVIWVEGPTERECFDLILAQELGGPVVGLSFVALRNTGDLDGKQADAALDIYDALTTGGSILPVSVWFSFDGEGKSERQLEDLQRRCGGRAKVLPRRMTENYLLNPVAIAHVLGAMGEEGVSAELIAQSLEQHAPSRMPKGRAAPYASSGYLAEVDGANLLKDVFHDVTEARQEYRKVRDGVELLRTILAEDPLSVEELIGYVRSLVS